MTTRLDRIVEVLKQSKEWNGCDNPETIIKREFPIYEKYSDTTVIPFLKAALIREARAKTLDVVEGVIFGGCDKKGTKLPVSWPVLLKNGKLVKVVSWNPNVIPAGIQFIKISGVYNPDFGNYSDIELIEAKPFTDLEILQKVALSVADENVWEHQKSVGDPVLVKGIVKWVNPLYEKDSDGNRGSPIPVVDQKGRPVFEIVLAFDGLVELHLRFVEQNQGVPFIGVKDINLLLSDVVKIHPNDPENQAKFLQTALKDRAVIGIGEVMNISERVTQDDIRTLPVYIRLTGLVEVPNNQEQQAPAVNTSKIPVSTTQAMFNPGETDEEFAARITESHTPEPPSPMPVSTGRKNAVEQIDLIVSQIQEYCDLIGKPVISINKDELKEAGIGEGSSDMLLTVALKKVQEAALMTKIADKPKPIKEN